MTAFLRMYYDRMLLSCSELELTGGLEQGRRDKGKYSFALDGDVVRRIKEQIPDLRIDSELMVRFKEISEKQKRALQIASATDWPAITDDRLFDYQKVAVAWLAEVERGILCDDMGLGKSVEALWAAEQTDFKYGLIVCGNAKIADWKKHAEEWTSRKVHVLTGDQSNRFDVLHDWSYEGGWLISNYKVAVIESEDLARYANLLIADEVHVVRNRKTESFLALKQIARRVRWAYLLTGTPTMNRTDDLYALLALVDLKRFGSYWAWTSRFCSVTTGYGGSLVVGGVKDEERENLNRLLSAYALGRPREVGVKLPPRTRRTVEYELKGNHLKLYKEFEETGIVTLTDKTVDVDVKIAMLTRLRQLAISPLLLDTLYTGPDKFDPLVAVIREKSTKAVVFSMYAEAIRWGAWKLNALGIKSVTFEGSMNDGQRKTALENFRFGDTQVFLATLKTAGEGLDLVEADRVVFLDLPWQREGINQGESRIYRLGQEAPFVETVFIHAKGTVEDHVRSIILRKEKVTINEVLKLMRGA